MEPGLQMKFKDRLQTESLSQKKKCVKVYVLPIKIENRIKVLKNIRRGSGEMALPEDRSPPSVTPVPEDLMPSSSLHGHCTYTGKILTHIRGSGLIPRTHSRCCNRLTSLTYNTKIAKHFWRNKEKAMVCVRARVCVCMCTGVTKLGKIIIYLPESGRKHYRAINKGIDVCHYL